jgi:hypothetical protein
MVWTGNSRCRAADPRSRRWVGLFAVLALMATAVSTLADPLTGTFELRNAAIEHDDQNYLLSAQVLLPVDDSVRDALKQGLPLRLELEVEVSRPRRFWPDATLAEATEHYELTYHAVTDRFRVDKTLDGAAAAPANGDQTTYSDLDSALAALGRIDRLPIVEQAAVDDARRYNVNVRATVSVGDLPATFKLLMFWREDWKRSTEWYAWPLSQ